MAGGLNIGEMFVRLSADTAPLTTSMREAQASMRRFEDSAKSAGQNFGKLRGPLTSIAGEVAGLDPKLASLASHLLSFTVGGAVTAGVLLGITALAKAFNKFADKVKEADDAVKAVEDRLSKQAEPPWLQAFNDMVAARTKLAELESQAAPLRASVAERQKMGAAGNVFGALDKERAALNVLEGEINKWTRLERIATKAMEDAKAKAAPALDGVTNSITKLGKAAKQATLSDFGGAGVNKFAESARQAIQKAIADALARAIPEWVKKLPPTLRPIEKTEPAPPPPEQGFFGKLAAAPGEAVSSALDTATDALGQFSPAIIGMTAAFEVLHGIMEPLQPILDVFANLLQSIGNVLGGVLQPVLKVVAKAFSYIVEAIGYFVYGLGVAVDKLVPDVISHVGKGLAEQGKEIVKNAKAQRDLLDQTKDAADYIGDLGDAARETAEALSNVPEIWSVSLARFRAAQAGVSSSAGPMPAALGASYTFTGSIVLPGVRNAPEFYREVATEAVRITARGGTPVLVDASTRRPY